MRWQFALSLAVIFSATSYGQPRPSNSKELAVEYLLGEPERLQARLAQRQAALAAMKKGKINTRQGVAISFRDGVYTFGSQDAKVGWIKSETKLVRDLEGRLKSFASGTVKMPDLVLDEVKVGKAGILTYPENVVDVADRRVISATIIQIVNDHEMIMRMFAQAFWVRMPTTGLVDDKEMPLEGLFVVSGTKTYTTTAGGSKTIFVLEPVDPEWLAAEVKKRLAKE